MCSRVVISQSLFCDQKAGVKCLNKSFLVQSIKTLQTDQEHPVRILKIKIFHSLTKTYKEN